ncbi:MAG: hypothetical protein COW08_06000, partial [Ignavibacteriales bacterium CG12_big_fil_rev_8_21_14_0_65_30_8]
MKLLRYFLFIIIFLTISLHTKESKLYVAKNNQSFFIANKGQWPVEVKYLARTGGMNAWITDFGVVYDYYKITQNNDDSKLSKAQIFAEDKFERENITVKGHVIKTIFSNKSSGQSFTAQG